MQLLLSEGIWGGPLLPRASQVEDFHCVVWLVMPFCCCVSIYGVVYAASFIYSPTEYFYLSLLHEEQRKHVAVSAGAISSFLICCIIGRYFPHFLWGHHSNKGLSEFVSDITEEES